MNNLRRISVGVFLLSLLTTLAWAQPGAKIGRIYGKVLDAATNKPLEFVTVTVLNAKDSQLVSGGITKSNGEFSITQLPLGAFKVQAKFIGYGEYRSKTVSLNMQNTELDLGNLKLKANSKSLNEVEIVGEKPTVQLAIDKKIFNVEKNITSEGGTASDALKQVPSVNVDMDGNVSLRGKSNVTILIDGKPSSLLGSDPAVALQNIPSASIESIEVITNPSSKYDAQGMGGIINIVLKKDRKMGMNGSLSGGVGSNDKYNARANVNLRNNKFNVFANYSFRSAWRNNFESNDRILNYGQPTAFGSYSETDGRRKSTNNFLNIGADYYIDNRNTISVNGNLGTFTWGGNQPNLTRYTDNAGNVFKYLNRYYEDEIKPWNYGGSIDYKRKFAKPGQELSANASYSRNDGTRSNTVLTRSFNGSEQQTGVDTFQNNPASSVNQNYNFQVDYTMPVLKTGKFETGYKTQITDFTTANSPTKTYNDGGQSVTVEDQQLKSAFDYNQYVNAVYANLSNTYGKLGYQAGLRLEQSSYTGHVAEMSEALKNQYLNLFPTAFLTYKLTPSQDLQLNYTRRINRPSFWNLFPYLNINDPQNITTGNPDLRPEFINASELTYSKIYKQGHTIIASAYVQYTTNLIQRVRSMPDSQGVTITKPFNLGSGLTYGAEITAKLQFTKWWDATLNANLYRNEINGSNIDPYLNNSGYSWFAKAITNFKLPYATSIQFTGEYQAPAIVAQGKTQEVYSIDFGLKKDFYKGLASLTFNVSDIFNTRKNITIFDDAGYYQYSYRKPETRIANLTLSIRFANKEGLKAAGLMRGKYNGNNKGTKDRNENLKGGQGEGGGDSGGF
jgi:outer membrane receptor protein involved in Fe transport